MKSRFFALFRKPSAGGFTPADMIVILALMSLIVAIFYPVFAHA